MRNFKEDAALNTLNHSCAHLMAQAVKHLYPQAKFWVGPVVEEGFYYDIDLGDDVIRDEDLKDLTIWVWTESLWAPITFTRAALSEE